MSEMEVERATLDKITTALVRRGLAESYKWDEGLTKAEIDFVEALCDLIDARIEQERNRIS